ncbi:MAG TPA: methyltransferase, partial [Algoriphagus sp.]|nr:methyltransferase [Algoriphagus sp.]
LYEQGHSLEVDENEFFSSEEMSDFHKKASLYNQEGRGDQALFILKKAD